AGAAASRDDLSAEHRYMEQSFTEVHADVRPDVAHALVRATEAAALKCARGIGRGDADRTRETAAVAMLHALEGLDICCRVVLGPRGDCILVAGASVGRPDAPHYDLGVYPVEGASLVARGLPGAISVLVAVRPNAFPVPPAVRYVDKIVAGPAARGALDLGHPLADNPRRRALVRNHCVSALALAIRDPPPLLELIHCGGS